MATKVTGEQYYDLDGQLAEIKRQLRQRGGYPHDPEKLRKHLQAAIEGRFISHPPVGKFLMTVKVGDCKSAEEFRNLISASGKQTDLSVNENLRKVNFYQQEAEFDIYEVTGEELGFTYPSPKRQQIYNAAINIGFLKSPAEVALKACIYCHDSKLRAIAMDPIVDDCGNLRLFRICNNWIHDEDGDPSNQWIPSYTWLFVWPRR